MNAGESAVRVSDGVSTGATAAPWIEPAAEAAEPAPAVGTRPAISATCAQAYPPGDSRIKESVIPSARAERKFFMRPL